MKSKKLYLLIALIFAALLTLPQVTPVGADDIITIEPDPIDGNPPPTEPPAETSPPEDLALNPSRTGYPHPLESDSGWGGGADKWGIVDGTRRYPDWYYGLAFTGGENAYQAPCGWRQATINFGQPTTFNRVMVWHHGIGHVPNTYKIQYFDGANWIDVFSTNNGHDYLVYPAETPTDWWHHFSTPTENTFAPVTSSKVRFKLNNCDIIHGWIYEFEVYHDENHPPVVATDQTSFSVDEGQTANNTGTVSDPDGDAVTLSASVGTVDNNGDGSWSWSYVTSDGPAESQTVTITANDGNGGAAQTTFELAVTNIEPTIDTISVPSTPVDINNQPVSVSGTFTDPAGDNDQPYTCTVDYGDGSGPQDGTITDKTCKGPYQTYAEPGVYQITMTVTDKDGGTGSAAATDLVVIYDPTGGFVTGGGWIMSPQGACQFDACTYDSTGKANFGFVSKYKKGADTPTGRTEFQFKAGNLNFHSGSYDWLVIAGPNAKYKGEGTINGSGNYGFMLTATDSEVNGGGEVDTFRIKIWDKDNDGLVVYDNKMDVSDDSYDGTELGGGNIKVHKGKKGK